MNLTDQIKYCSNTLQYKLWKIQESSDVCRTFNALRTGVNVCWRLGNVHTRSDTRRAIPVNAIALQLGLPQKWIKKKKKQITLFWRFIHLICSTSKYLKQWLFLLSIRSVSFTEYIYICQQTRQHFMMIRICWQSESCESCILMLHCARKFPYVSHFIDVLSHICCL